MASLFTVVLTKGCYVVAQQDAEAVLKAVEDQQPHVLVRADLLGDGLVFSPVRLVTAHVIAVVANEQADPVGVSPLRSL